jgi:hypothetical protein
MRDVKLKLAAIEGLTKAVELAARDKALADAERR